MTFAKFIKKNIKIIFLIILIPQIFLLFATTTYEKNNEKCFIRAEIELFRDVSILKDLENVLIKYIKEINKSYTDSSVEVSGDFVNIKSKEKDSCMIIHEKIQDFSKGLDDRMREMVAKNQTLKESLNAYLIFEDFGEYNIYNIRLGDPQNMENFYKNYKTILPFTLLALTLLCIFIFFMFRFFFDIKFSMRK